jgi:hypothetical protein
MHKLMLSLLFFQIKNKAKLHMLVKHLFMNFKSNNNKKREGKIEIHCFLLLINTTVTILF